MAPTIKPTLLGNYAPNAHAFAKGMMVSEKLDGWRAMYVDGAFYSRSGQALLLPGRMYAAVEAICEKAGVNVLDGELWCGIGAGSSSVPAGILNGTVKYMVFDGFSSACVPAWERYQRLCEAFESKEYDLVNLVPQTRVTTIAEADEIYEQLTGGGSEGIVLKPVSMPVNVDGRRCNDYQKRKPVDTAEFVVKGYALTAAAKAKGAGSDSSGYVSSLVCACGDGKEFKVAFKGFSPPPIGSHVTLRYSSLTVHGLPKFAVYEGRRDPRDMTSRPEDMTSRPEDMTSRPRDMTSRPRDMTSRPKEPEDIKTVPQVPVQSDAKAKGGYVLKNGESVQVASDKDPSLTYTVTRAHKGASVYCSCPAWKFQRLNPAVRTCKHCIAVCGAKEERLRTASATLHLSQMNDCMGTSYKV